MTTGEQIFLALCRELSFRRAAEKCYISQQGLSEHIRRLEKQYGVTLFQRRPRVALTLAGQALRRTLEQKQIMECDLEREIEGLRSGSSGKVVLGVGISRARIYLPRILESFWQQAPGVEVVVRMDDTAQLEQQLSAGKLDCYIGTDAECGENQVCRKLRGESIQLLAPCRLLPPGWNKTKIKPAELAELCHMPFVRNSPGSILNAKVDAVLRTSGTALHQIADVSDYEIQLDFCRRGWAAAFLPEIVLESYNAERLQREQMRLVEIEGLECAMEIDLVWDESRIYPMCVKNLLDCMQSIAW